jgi:hypothetical protein
MPAIASDVLEIIETDEPQQRVADVDGLPHL